METKKNRKENRGWGIYFFFIAGVILMWYLSTMGTNTKTTTAAYFEKALSEKTVESVQVTQNAAVPTGYLTIKFTDGATANLYVSDVNEAQALMSGSSFNVASI